jgi:hypothetical protein
MAEIINFTGQKQSSDKPTCKGRWLIDHPADRKIHLGQVDDYGSFVVVRPMPTAGAARKRYELDTTIEGIRLLLRLHGLHRATVAQAEHGYAISLPALFAGDAQ